MAIAAMPSDRCSRTLAPALAAVTLAYGSNGWSMEQSFDAGVAMAYDTNVTRAQLREDIRADAAVDARGAATLQWPLGDGDRISLSGGARAAYYLRYPRLSLVAGEASAGWQRKLGVGLTAPWIAASATLAHESYGDAVRDSDRVEARLSAGQRLSERFDGSLGYVFDRRYAHHDDALVPGISGAVWDVAGHTGFARLGYALSERWQVDAGYAYRHGDVVSTTHRNLAIFLASDAIGESSAFGPGFFDYRLRGTTQTGSASLSYALGASAALDVSYAYAFTRATHGLEYESHVVGASWTYRY